MSPERRKRPRRKDHATTFRTFWRDGVRDLMFVFGMLDERNNPSATRMIAVWLAFVGGHGRVFHDQPLTAWDVTLLLFAAFAALGKSGLELYGKFKTDKLGVEADQVKAGIIPPVTTT